MTYPMFMRKKILAELETNSFRKTAKKYNISTYTLYSWTKCIDIKETHDRNPRTIQDEHLLQDIKDYPDAYQWERASRLNCSQSGICKALKRLGITRKKILHSETS